MFCLFISTCAAAGPKSLEAKAPGEILVFFEVKKWLVSPCVVPNTMGISCNEQRGKQPMES